MAKNNKNEELEINIDDEIEVGDIQDSEQQVEDNTKEPEEVQFSDDNLVQEAPGPKRVKIRVQKYHRCNIGGVWYELHPNREYSVPVNVRDILRNAKTILQG